MKLPILMSVPHAGLRVPPEAQPYCRLSHDEIVADGDEGSAEIFSLADHVAQFITTDIARAIVDLNRAEDDFRPDGVIKTHTCWNVPVYDQFPPPSVTRVLFERFYRPYHAVLETPHAEVRLCIDCHTMAAVGPPIGPDTGDTRPAICLGDCDGKTLPTGWMTSLADCFGQAFAQEVAINQPFSGGYITRRHGQDRPWLQVELSRAPFLTNAEKRARVLLALNDFTRRML